MHVGKQLYLFGSICSILILIQTNLWAQNISTPKDSVAKNKSSWQIGISYLSNDVYLGRKDSIVVPYINSSVSYHDKSGFFINGSLSYLPGSDENRIDVVTIEGGYNYTSDNFSAEFSGAKDFYNDQSFAVSSEIKGRMSAFLSYDLGFIEPSLNLGVNFSNSPDLGLGLGLAHTFSFIEDQLVISPAFHVNAGMQNYYSSYYSKRRYSAKRKSRSVSSTITASVTNASRFQIMDYEWEVPIEYSLNKKIKFNFTPTLAMPVNPATVTIATKSSRNNTSTQTSMESLSNTYYFSLGFSYTFSFQPNHH
jgi:hypothetical protein